MNGLLVPQALCVHAQWLEAAQRCLKAGSSMVLITVARALGSTPRDAGAHMWVDDTGAHGTIGGGHLELQAIETARAMLVSTGTPVAQVRHYALGPSLGQCCGGAVWLAFERLQAQDLQWCEALQAILASGASAQRTRHITPADAGNQEACHLAVGVEPSSDSLVRPDAQWHKSEGRFVDVTPGTAPLIVVCGAGHVGKAIVRVLAELPVRVAWLDPREDEWPAYLPANVLCVNGDADDVVDFPDDAIWLVLTHSHALDQEIIERVFTYRAFRYLGLIGSETKRAKFRSRLLQKFSPELVDRMICPIGTIETSSKLPGLIAVSVAAQIVGLLEHR